MLRFWRKESLISGLLILLVLCGVTSLGYAETDVTAKIELVKSRLMFDLGTNTSYLNVSVKNISQDVLLTPIKVVISGISDASVTVSNADGVTGDGKLFFEYATQTGQLLAGGTTANKRVSFKNVKRLRFTYVITVYASLPEAASLVLAAGGEIVVTDSNSPIYGCKLQIPKNTFNGSAVVSVTELSESSLQLPQGSIPASPPIRLNASVNIDRPIKVVLPVSTAIANKNDLVIYHYSNTTGYWNIIPVSAYDPESNCVEFVTSSFSDFQAVSFENKPKCDRVL